jgi:ribonuclease BN (tRNA processing enzyme)
MRLVTVVCVIAAASLTGQSRAGTQTAGGTRVVMLGTGTPRPEPDRAGPATAIVVNGAAYLVDAGPGIVRRAEAARRTGIDALAADKLVTAFITHLHSDHTVGYPDLIFTTWVQGRHAPLNVYGPAGLESMTKYILLAWQADIDILSKGLEQRRADAIVEAHDVKPGVVYKDPNVTVTAFQNAHGEWPQTFGYKFSTPDRTIVVSGDTSPSPGVVDNCRQCDVLVHEAYLEEYRPADMPNWIEYRSKYHTTAAQLAEIANRTKPGLLVVYHHGAGSDAEYAAAIQRGYAGKVAIARDLDVY